MKKSIIALAFAAACLSACASDIIISVSQLPKAAQTFVKTHFAEFPVSIAEKDLDSYDVKLTNGWEIEFNKKGEWKEVDCKESAVPASVLALVPATIRQYVTRNYPGTSIVSISKGRDYDVELSNDVDLEFSLKGDFIKID